MKNTKCEVNVSKDTVQNTYTFEFKTLKDIKIIDARLLLKTSDNCSDVKVYNHVEGNENDPWLVDLIKTIKSGEETTINISDELQFAIDSGKNSLKLSFEPTLNTSNITIVDSSCSIELEYISMSEYKSNGSTHSVNVGKAGTATVDLATGKMSVQTPLFSTDKKALPVSVCANYNSVKNELLPDVGLPNNWSLNLNQFLIKEETDDGSLKFSYIDENGKNQIIEEKYYYLDENEKRVYIPRTKLSVDLDGNLIYEENLGNGTTNHSIETSLEAPSGLKLISTIADIKGANLVDYEPEELANVKAKLKEYNKSKENINKSLKLYYKQLCLMIMSKEALKKQVSTQKQSIPHNKQYLDLLKKIEYIRGEYARKNRTFRCPDDENVVKSYAKNYLSDKRFSDEILQQLISFCKSDTQIINSKNEPLTSLDVGVVVDALLEESSSIYSFGYNYNNSSVGNCKLQELNNTLSEEMFNEISKENFQSLIEDYVGNSLSTDLIDFTTIFNDFKGKDSESKLSYSLKDIITLDLQIENIINTINQYLPQQEEIQSNIKKLEHQQKIYELQVPVHYLYNDNNVVYGFGKTLDAENKETNVYRLILISDTYKNTIFISYKSISSNLIEKIIDSSDNSILFTYEKDKLEINSPRNRNVTLIFDNNKLKQIIHTDNTSSYYNYNGNDLSALINTSGFGAQITYENSKVKTIKPISGIKPIINGKYSYKEGFGFSLNDFSSFLLADKGVEFIYNNYTSTTIKDAKNKNYTSIFDKYGNIKTTYENNFDENDYNFSRVNEFSYNDNKVSQKITSLPYSKNYLMDINFEGTSVSEISALHLGNCVSDKSTIPYVFKVFNDKIHSLTNNAQKATITIPDTIIKELLDNENNCIHKSFIVSGWAKADSAYIDDSTARKFEIRIELTFSDNTTKSVSKSFDWRNTSWQYCAVPFILDTKKQIKNIVCYFDYTDNVNTSEVKFTDFMLKEADWETISYNSSNLPIRKDSAHSKWSTIYEYDKDDRLVKEVVFEKKENETDENVSIANVFTTTYEYTKQGKLLRVTDYNDIVKENIYNKDGIIVKTITYNKKEPSSKFYKEKLVDDKGNETGSLNEFGEKIVNYKTIDGTGIVSAKEDQNGFTTSFDYDQNDNLIETTATADGISNTNTFDYTLDFMTSLKHNNFETKYDYDDRGRITKIDIANNKYLSKTYGEDEETTALSSNEEFRQTFNNNNDVLETYYKKDKNSKEELILQNVYDTFGNLVFVKDLVSDNVHKLYYDKFGNTYKEENNQHNKQLTVENSYDDSHKNITNTTITIDGNKLSYKYEYNENESKPESKLSKTTLLNQSDSEILNQKIDYDKLGRVSKTSTNNISKEFTYLKVGDHTSTLVSKIQYATNNINKNSLRYLYDEKGNITEVRENNSLLARYKYDGLSRIVREDNKILEKTTTFAYDAGGNITERIEYPFTLVDNLDALDGTPITYSYSSTGWRDQLMEFKGEKFEYDAIGNPTTYRGNTLKWSHGRQLDKYSKINKDNGVEIPTASYTYNANGIRTSKTYYTDTSCQCKSETNTCACEESNCFTTKFFLNGNKIIKQYDCCNDLTFYYGADGLTGFHIKSANAKYEDENLDHDFFYKKNLQGDIIGIIDSNGEELVNYVYDAWGNHTAYNAKTNDPLDISSYESYINTSNIEQFIAIKNPFRYRGYYYDFETGLYYLNSRYYDPEIGRFVNADNISILLESKELINGLNLYAYCNNNPIINSDELGDAWWHWLVGALIILVAAALTVVTAGGFAAAGTAIAGVFTGVSVGGAAGFFASVTVGAAITAVIGAFSGGITAAINGDSILDGASSGFMWGAISGALSGAFGFFDFGGVGDLHNQYTRIAVGNIIQAVGQGTISLGVYITRSLIEGSQITLAESLFAFGGGFAGGLISYVAYETQLFVSILSELAQIAFTYFKKTINLPENWLL